PRLPQGAPSRGPSPLSPLPTPPIPLPRERGTRLERSCCSPSSPGEGGGRGREKRAGVMRVLGGGSRRRGPAEKRCRLPSLSASASFPLPRPSPLSPLPTPPIPLPRERGTRLERSCCSPSSPGEGGIGGREKRAGVMRVLGGGALKQR